MAVRRPSLRIWRQNEKALNKQLAFLIAWHLICYIVSVAGTGNAFALRPNATVHAGQTMDLGILLYISVFKEHGEPIPEEEEPARVLHVEVAA
jgi:hypothetical protein